MKLLFNSIIICIFLFTYNNLFSDNMDDYRKKKIVEYTKKINQNPKGADNYYYRGLSYILLKEQAKALNDFNKAIELNVNYEQAYFEKAKIMLDKEEYSEALKSVNRVMELRKKRSKKILLVFYKIRGMCYLGLHNLDKSIADHTKVIKAGPDKYYNQNYLESLYQRAFAYNIKKNFRKSIQDIYELKKFVKPSINLSILEGMNYYDMNYIDRSIKIFNKVIEFDNRNSDAYVYLSLCFIKKKKYSEAEDYLIRAIKNDCKNIDYLEVEEFKKTFGKKKIKNYINQYCGK